ncbi:hypothetical protein BKA64DRAFT_354662 [Cadophora sp. MPI-SDFR-AT-0126]|nr:hypothetical protein BKA64DRAFT_354662 [Leotiomycetes sp. MPI-SDFR-AT-0126]
MRFLSSSFHLILVFTVVTLWVEFGWPRETQNNGISCLVYLDSVHRLRWDEHVYYRRFGTFNMWIIQVLWTS